MTHPINRIPLTIIRYVCRVCMKVHQKPSKAFFKHYAANAKFYGWAPLEKEKTT